MTTGHDLSINFPMNLSHELGPPQTPSENYPRGQGFNPMPYGFRFVFKPNLSLRKIAGIVDMGGRMALQIGVAQCCPEVAVSGELQGNSHNE